jgi:AbrB family looped-hinge helix DNA binding protein
VKTRVSSKGRIVLPAELRRQDRIVAGEEFDVERVAQGEYRISRVRRGRNRGLLQLLLACPVKGCFKPAPRTETTDDIQAPTFE